MKLRSERIEERLKEIGQSKGWLHQELGISRQSFNQTLKRDNPSTSTIQKIADKLQTNPIDLIELEEGFEHVYSRGKWNGIKRVRNS